MKAVQIDEYRKGSVEVALREVEIPTIGHRDVLIRVHAAGVNPIDVLIAHGDVKFVTPYRFPLTLGNEMAGVVESVGRDVTEFKPGDRVFARLPTNSIGAFAEYVAAPAEALALIPDYLSFHEAATIPLAALTTLQALDLLSLKRGERLFISGGSGSLGAIAIPLAVASGLKVVTSGGARSKERVMALGASQYFDYKTEDYTQQNLTVDGVIDTLGGNETQKQLQILKKGGALVALRGMPDGKFAKNFGLPMWKQWLLSVAGMKLNRQAAKRQQRYHFLFAQASGRQLQQAATILTQKNIRPEIASVFPLTETSAALTQVATGHSQGKTIIEVKK